MKTVAGTLLVAGLLLGGTAASAQSRSDTPRSKEVPDYAAVLSTPLVTSDARTGRKHVLSDAEVERRVRASSTPRTALDRRASASLNRAIHDMPATREDARRLATVARDGTVTTPISREELEPVRGVRTAEGGMRAAHGRGPAIEASR